MTVSDKCDIISELLEKQQAAKRFESLRLSKKSKNLLTETRNRDKVYRLSPRRELRGRQKKRTLKTATINAQTLKIPRRHHYGNEVMRKIQAKA